MTKIEATLFRLKLIIQHDVRGLCERGSVDTLVVTVMLIHALVISVAYLMIQKICVIDTVAKLAEVLT